MSTLEADAEEAKKWGNVVCAARDGRKGAVRHFLKEDPTCVKKADEFGQTALHLATARGHGSIVELLLQHGADIEAKKKDGLAALHFAAANGRDSTIELLLNHGAHVTAKNNKGQTALHMAAANGHGSNVELLLKNKAPIEGKSNDGGTALHLAAANGRDSTVELLLKHGADVTATNNSGHKPVDVAKTDEIKALLRKAEEKEKEEVAQCKDILDAAEKGLVKAAEHFLRRDPKCMEAKNADGGTALHIAAEKGHEGMIALLLDRGAAVKAKDEYGLTALHLAAYCGHVHVIRALAVRDVDLDVKENEGKTPAELAKEQGHSAVEILLQELRGERQKEKAAGRREQAAAREAKADAEEAATCKGGVVQAARDGLLGAVRHLVKEDPECIQKKDRFGKTALHLAAEKGNGSIVQLLLSQGAAVDSKTIDGLAALHLAASNGQIQVVKLLASQGASPDLKGNNGKTPADVAEEKGHKEIVILLRSGGAGESSKDQKPAESWPVEESQSSESAPRSLAGAAGPALLKVKAEAQAPQPSPEAASAKKVESTPARAQEREARTPAGDASAQSQAAPGHGLPGAGGNGACPQDAAAQSQAPEAIEIPDGTEAPISMFSARFDGGPIEMKFREVHRLLTDHNFKSLMVSAGGSDDFGVMTLKCLGEVQSKGGIMIAVCTQNYGEMTSSPYSSNAELRFAFDEKVKVLPLKVADVYPPQPPGGPGHPFDPDDTAKTLCKMVFKGSVVFLDCREKSAREIAAMIAHALLKK